MTDINHTCINMTDVNHACINMTDVNHACINMTDVNHACINICPNKFDIFQAWLTCLHKNDWFKSCLHKYLHDWHVYINMTDVNHSTKKLILSTCKNLEVSILFMSFFYVQW